MNLKRKRAAAFRGYGSFLYSAGAAITFPALHLFNAFDEGFQLAAAAGVAELAESLGFDLPDALARDLEALADFFQRVLGAVFEAEAHLDDTLFARGEGAENLRGVLLEVDADDGLGGRDGLAIFNEVAEVRVFLFADGGFERDGLLRDFEHLADLGDRDVHAAGDLFAAGLAAKLLDQLRLVRMSLLMVSIMCTGMRMVRAWSAMARVMA